MPCCQSVWWSLAEDSGLPVHVRACTRKGLGSLICKGGFQLSLNEQGGFSSCGRMLNPLYVDLQCRTLDCHGGSTVTLS